jgi:hypothetical protein
MPFYNCPLFTKVAKSAAISVFNWKNQSIIVLLFFLNSEGVQLYFALNTVEK